MNNAKTLIFLFIFLNFELFEIIYLNDANLHRQMGELVTFFCRNVVKSGSAAGRVTH